MWKHQLSFCYKTTLDKFSFSTETLGFAQHNVCAAISMESITLSGQISSLIRRFVIHATVRAGCNTFKTNSLRQNNKHKCKFYRMKIRIGRLVLTAFMRENSGKKSTDPIF